MSMDGYVANLSTVCVHIQYMTAWCTDVRLVYVYVRLDDRLVCIIFRSKNKRKIRIVCWGYSTTLLICV